MAFIFKSDYAWNLGIEGVVLADAHIIPRLQPRASLANEYRPARNILAVEALDAEPLRIRVSPVA
jgi:hypothetical protein